MLFKREENIKSICLNKLLEHYGENYLFDSLSYTTNMYSVSSSLNRFCYTIFHYLVTSSRDISTLYLVDINLDLHHGFQYYDIQKI